MNNTLNVKQFVYQLKVVKWYEKEVENSWESDNWKLLFSFVGVPFLMKESIASRLKAYDAPTTHEDIVRMTSEKVLEQSIPWEGYQGANIIDAAELEYIKKYDKKSSEIRMGLINRVSLFHFH